MSTDQPIDRRTARIQVSAEQDRLTRAADIEQHARQTQLDIERRRQEIQLQKEQRAAKKQERDDKRLERQQARAKLFARIHKLTPTLGRRAMICGPIIAPMAVAWIGQISFAHDTLKWPLLGALVFAAAWELTTAFAGWMYHQARKDGDRGTLFRCATWLFACSAGAMNYWHALDGVSIYKPTPKAVSYGAMSLVGIALWELYSSLIHRKHLRADGKVAEARPRFGVARWARYPRITWTAWSLAVRYEITTVSQAWSTAIAEIEKRGHKSGGHSAAAVGPQSSCGPGATTGQGHKTVGGHNASGGHSGTTVPGPRQATDEGATIRATELSAAPVAPGPGENVAPSVAPAKSNLVEFTPRGQDQKTMRAHWDDRIAAGVIPSGADLNRAAHKDPKYSLGKKYAKQWRELLPEEFVEAVEAGRTEEAREIAAGFSADERKEAAR
jgi:hypothetical protein